MHWGHNHFHRDQGMTLAPMGKFLKFCEFVFFNKKHFNKVNLKEISEPQNIDHTTQSGLHAFWFVLAMVFGEMNSVIWGCMLSHFLKKVFLQCRCYQGWFQYPSSWKSIIIMNSWIHNFYPVPWGNQVAKHNKQHVQFFSYPPTLPPSGFLLVDS